MKSALPDRPPLILASGSPRRRQLLAEAGWDFEVILPHPTAEDAPRPAEAAEAAVRRLASAKAADVARSVQHGWILAADTLVECEGQIVGKPADRVDAARILRFLSGRIHRVWTGLCLIDAASQRQWLATDVTELEMQPIDDAELQSYLTSGRWQGKAGAFGYQDGNAWVRIVRGSDSNVVGLPLERLNRLLEEAARDLHLA